MNRTQKLLSGVGILSLLVVGGLYGTSMYHASQSGLTSDATTAPVDPRFEELASYKAQLSLLKEQKTSAESDLEIAKANYSTSIDTLKKELTSLSVNPGSTDETALAAIDAIVAKQKAAEDSLAKITSDIAAQNETIQKNTATIAVNNSKISENIKNRAVKNKKLATLDTRLRTATGPTKTALQKEIGVLSKEILALDNDNTKLTNTNKSLTKANTTAKNKITSLKKQETVANTTVKSYAKYTVAIAASAEVRKLSKSIEDKQKEIVELEKEVIDIEKLIADLEKLLQDLWDLTPAMCSDSYGCTVGVLTTEYGTTLTDQGSPYTSIPENWYCGWPNRPNKEGVNPIACRAVPKIVECGKSREHPCGVGGRAFTYSEVADTTPMPLDNVTNEPFLCAKASFHPELPEGEQIVIVAGTQTKCQFPDTESGNDGQEMGGNQGDTGASGASGESGGGYEMGSDSSHKYLC